MSHGAGAAAHVPNACGIVWYAPEGFSTDKRYSEACKVFQMIEVFGGVHDFPRFKVLGSAQDFEWPGVLGIVRDFPEATKS